MLQYQEHWRRLEYVRRCRVFINNYFKNRKITKTNVLLWSDDRVMQFINTNFEFFHNVNNPDVILLLPKCSEDINAIKNHLLPF